MTLLFRYLPELIQLGYYPVRKRRGSEKDEPLLDYFYHLFIKKMDEQQQRRILSWLEEDADDILDSDDDGLLINIAESGEAASADKEAASLYPGILMKMIEDGGYSSQTIFKVDETGLFWMKMPKELFLRVKRKTFQVLKSPNSD
ncbi:unnamed protein product [Parnassius apollo]|uniref:(apollo) hypothetical protein n=1 Tax=Parnassius apollo TaxID=110799 RepID=A0A8S3Y9Q1_PARAO|nr:unnamed protein product [Parnassius apollo]